MGTAAPSQAGSAASTTPDEATKSGRTARGMPNSSSSSSAHSNRRRSSSRVRDALLKSVTWRRPPVRRHTRKLSMVPARRRPLRSRSLAPGRFASNHSSFVALKYGSRRSPVSAATLAAPARPSSSSAHRSAVRRHCQTIAFPSGLPVSESHNRTVSRWFAIPTAARSAASIPDCRSASRQQRSCVAQISSGSCSTHPGSG